MSQKKPSKKSITLNVPQPISDAFAAASDDGTVNGKQKWMVLSAAVLLYLDAPPDVRKAMLGLIANAELGAAHYNDLIDSAKAHRLRAEIDRDSKPKGRRPGGG